MTTIHASFRGPEELVHRSGRGVLLCALLLCASCEMLDVDDGYDAPYADTSSASYAELDVISARLEGDMGSIARFAGGAEAIGASNDYVSLLAIDDGRSDTPTVETSGGPSEPAQRPTSVPVVIHRRWAVMLAVGLRGVTLDDPAIVAGTHLEQGTMIGNRTVALSVLGCSGPNASTWTFDTTTRDVTIDIEEGSRSDTRRANVTATWGASTTRASFEYALARPASGAAPTRE